MGIVGKQAESHWWAYNTSTQFFVASYHQIKKHVTTINHMTKSLDKTLEAFQNVEDAIIDIKTQRNVMTDKNKIADYDKILI
jgi:hypothetical protein